MKPTAKINRFKIIKNVFGIFIIFLSAASVFGQNKNKQQTANQPQIHTNVHRQYDDKGNLIGYDSTYTWSYSNVDTTGNMMPADSIFSAFFPKGEEEMMNPFSFLENDSLMFNSFPGDFFDNSMPDMNKQIQQMLKEQEELSKRFMLQKPMIPAPDEKEKKPEKSEQKETTPPQPGVDL